MATLAITLAQRDLTDNPGILPIKLGDSKLQTTSHSFIHFLNISPLIKGYGNIIKQFFIFKNKTLADKNLASHLVNNFEIVHHVNQLIKEKLSIFSKPVRTKRGLIDGLGYVVKQITGNLDADDGKDIEKSLQQLKQNQYNLHYQISNQYSINNEIMTKFNNTLKIIKNNENLIVKRIQKFEEILKDTVNSNINTLHTKITINDLTNALNLILNVLQDIENSITFCHLKIVHPSIITNNQLMQELQKIYPHYTDQFPFNITSANIKYFKEITLPNCFIKDENILYTLNIPLFSKENFNLFYFLPIPSKNFTSIIPNNRYVLSSESSIVPLSGTCKTILNKHLCEKELKTYQNTSCETSILRRETTQNCFHIQLPKENVLEYIPETNQYVAALAKPTPVKINCKSVWSTKSMQGTFLFDDESCEYIVDGQKLSFNEKTYGKPLIMQDFHLDTLSSTAHPLPEIKMKQIVLSHLSNNLQPIHIDYDTEDNDWHLFGTILLYATLIGATLYLLFRRLKKRNYRGKIQIEEINLQDIKL